MTPPDRRARRRGVRLERRERLLSSGVDVPRLEQRRDVLERGFRRDGRSGTALSEHDDEDGGRDRGHGAGTGRAASCSRRKVASA